MNIENVIQELERMRTEFHITAFDSEDFDKEKRWSDRVEVLAEAIEYLWQYQDLME